MAVDYTEPLSILFVFLTFSVHLLGM